MKCSLRGKTIGIFRIIRHFEQIKCVSILLRDTYKMPLFQDRLYRAIFLSDEVDFFRRFEISNFIWNVLRL